MKYMIYTQFTITDNLHISHIEPLKELHVHVDPTDKIYPGLEHWTFTVCLVWSMNCMCVVITTHREETVPL